MINQRHLLVHLLLWSSCSGAFAQTPCIQWDRRLGGTDSEVAEAQLATPDGGLIIAGRSLSGIGGDKSETSLGSWDMWLVKLDASRNKVWDKRYGSANDEYGSVRLSTAQNGDFYVACSIEGNGGDITQPTNGGIDYWVLRLDTSGSKLWDKRFGGAAHDRLFALITTSDGGFLIGGYSFSGISGDRTEASRGGSDYWVVKCDLNGTKQWDKRYGGSVADVAFALAQTTDGGYVVSGYSDSGAGGDRTQASRGLSDYWMVRTNASGAKLWDRRFGTTAIDFPEGLVLLANGNILLSGSTSGGINGDKTQDSRGGTDYWLVMVGPTGAKLWDKRFGGASDEAWGMAVEVGGGGFLISGLSFSSTSGDKSEDVRGTNDLWIVRSDAAGTKLWDRTLGGSATDNSRVKPAYASGIITVLGETSSPVGYEISGTPRGLDDYWVIGLTDEFIPTQYPDVDGDGYGDPAGPVSSCAVIPGYTFTSNDDCPTVPGVVGTPCDDGNACSVNDALNAVCQCAGISGDADSDGICDAQDNCPNTAGVLGSACDDANPNTVNDVVDPNCNCLGVGFPCLGWERRFGGAAEDAPTAIIITADGGYLVGGTSSSDSGGDHAQSTQGGQDYWVVKLDAAGSLQWEKRFGTSANDALTAIATTVDGGYLLAGTSSGDISGDRTEATRGGNDFWVLKIDASGTKIWDKRFGGAGSDALYHAIRTNDGGFLLGGSSTSGIGGDKTEASRGGSDYWAVKIDAAGTKLWDKRFGGTAGDDLTRVAQLGTGEFLLAGHSSSPFGGDKSQSAYNGSPDYWVVKMNAAGTAKVWDSRHGSNGLEQLTGLGVTANGTILISGYASPLFNGISGNRTDLLNGLLDLWVVALDPGTGLRLWDEAFGGDDIAIGGGMIMTSDNGAVLVTALASDVGNDVSEPSRGDRDFWMLRMDAAGGPFWDKRYGGNLAEEATCVVANADGSFVMAGKSSSGVSGDKSQPSQGLTDYWVVKTVPTALLAHPDVDGDTYGDPNVMASFCGTVPVGYVQNDLDCDDADAAAYPGAPCNDGNSGTTLDQYNATCVCAGTNFTVRIAPKVFLDGSFDPGTNLLADGLRVSGLLPGEEPYTVLGYAHVGGGGGEVLFPGVLSVTGNNAIADWVVVELRSNANPTTVLATRSALVQRDGDVVDVDGISSVGFTLATGTYKVAMRHRNHLGAMTLNGVALNATAVVVDLTATGTVTYGTNARKANGTKQTLWPGDVVRDGTVKYTGANNDRDPILIAIGGSIPTATITGYHSGDVNLDGVVKYTGTANDRDPVLQTIGGSVPTAIRVQQLP